MKRTLLLIALALACPLGVARADETLDIAGRMQKISQESMAKLQGPGVTMAARNAAMKARAEALQDLLKEAEAADAAQLPAEQLVAFSKLCLQMRKADQALKHAEAAVAKNPELVDARAQLVLTLANSDVEGAEEAFAEALKKFPDEPRISSLHGVLYMPNMRARKYERAGEHVVATLDSRGTKFSAAHGSGMFGGGSEVGQMVQAFQNARKPELALAQLDKLMARVDEASQKEGADKLSRLASDLVGQKARLLNGMGKQEEAAKLVDEAIAKAQESLKGAPDDMNAAMRVAGLLSAKADVAQGDDADAAKQAYVAFLDERMKSPALNSEIALAWVNGNMTSVSAMLNADKADEASARLKELQGMVASLTPAESLEPEQKKAYLAAVTLATNQLGMQARRIESELARAKLIGQPAPVVETTAWVNGSPVAPADTKGKVVLLDFWAVWCGPCVATFPHLREWHEKYSDKGLVIIGATKHYGYGWNADEKRIEKIEDLSQEDERVAMAEFAKHHQLHHALAVMPDDELSKAYGVSGIPQAVVIDRAGRVRIIKVGSGEPNAKAIEAMLEKCLEETPESAAQAPAAGG